MSAIWKSARELWGLFVEDASFTIGIVGVVLIAALGFRPIGIPGPFRGVLLFVLVVLVLIENVIRSARLPRPPSA